jgi:hypothetical protein
MQRTSQGSNGGSPLISVLCRREGIAPLKRVAKQGLTSILVCFSLSLATCGPVDDEPLPEVKRWPQEVECSLPPPAPLQVAGPDVESCIPDSAGEFYAEVGLTISSEGRVTALRLSNSVNASVAACIRKAVPSMEFLVLDLCHKGSVDVDLAFGRGGVS